MPELLEEFDQARQQLGNGLSTLAIPVNESQIDCLMQYLQLLRKWNTNFNIVGTSEPSTLIYKHLLDSLSIAQFIQNAPILDVGSGAGLPGIPLAITLPELRFTLLDTNGKKTRFMRQVVIELKLQNVEVVQADVTKFKPELSPKTVLARAFAPLEQTLVELLRVCDHSGQLMVMLGKQVPELPLINGLSRIITQKVHVPGLDSSRHLLIAQKI